ncbi:MAG: lipoyl domain-containing protein [Nitrospirales bacterium]|nr:lipoyl domain-containing protein [Nitrospirales bacterium]
MTTDIVMPQLGESIAEGTIVKWLIPLGGHVQKDESLLEVETDKVALDIPSPATGSLSEILIQEGETVPVGTFSHDSIIIRNREMVLTKDNHPALKSLLIPFSRRFPERLISFHLRFVIWPQNIR